MHYNPYLDIDWTEVSPEVSHLLWLTDEEMNIRKTQETQKRKNYGRTTKSDSRRTQEYQKAA